jgi:hypothetical protein
MNSGSWVTTAVYALVFYGVTAVAAACALYALYGIWCLNSKSRSVWMLVIDYAVGFALVYVFQSVLLAPFTGTIRLALPLLLGALGAIRAAAESAAGQAWTIPWFMLIGLAAGAGYFLPAWDPDWTLLRNLLIYAGVLVPMLILGVVGFIVRALRGGLEDDED